MKKIVKKLDTAIYEKEGKIARIILNRPEKLNALNASLRWDIVRCIDMIEEDDNVLVGIIKGNGRAFCSGGDLGGVYSRYGAGEKLPDGSNRRPSQRATISVDESNASFADRIAHCWKPMICQAHGYCLGWGLILADSCDLTIAAEDCQFGHPEQRQAFGGQVGIRDILILGLKKAREMMLLGSRIDGKEAERIGWINKAVPTAQLEAEVEKIAHNITLLPRDAVALGRTATMMAVDTLLRGSGVPMHAISQNIRFEPDEFNFISSRAKMGTREAIKARDARWESSGKQRRDKSQK